jgi:hypothetical protein
VTRTSAAVLWALFATLAFGVAPPVREDWWAWCVALVAGDWAGENPAVVAHFQLMGLWPLAWAALLRDELRARPLPAWPFVLGSMALGALALLPWFVLRPAGSDSSHAAGPLERLFARRGVLAVLAGLAVVLGGWGLLRGDLVDWRVAASTEGFMFTMSWDFLTLWVASALVARSQARPGEPWTLTLAPILGVVAWVLVRDRRGAA